MGYRGKLSERGAARELRATAMTLADIAAKLGVSKATVSVWVRDVDFEPSPRRTGGRRRDHAQHTAKLAEIEQCNLEGRERLGQLSQQAFLAAGLALYAGEGAKRDGAVVFANTDPALVGFFCDWFRHFFVVEESRFRLRIYLHDDLDMDRAVRHWTEITNIAALQLIKPYRPRSKHGPTATKHEYGCAYISYSSTSIHRQITGLIAALMLPYGVHPG